MKRHIAVALMVLAVAGVASAQDDRGATIGGSVSATDMDGRTSFSFAGTFGFRFTRIVGLELEATVVPTLKSEFPGATIQTLTTPTSVSIIQIYPNPRFQNFDGRAVMFLNDLRVAIPTTTTRVEPYFITGGGIASVRHTADLVYTVPSPLVPGIPLPIPPRTITQPVVSSSVDLALTLGGGVGIRIGPRVWLDADLRLFRLLGEDDRNVGRFGVGVRYRF